jgi:predicted esterase
MKRLASLSLGMIVILLSFGDSTFLLAQEDADPQASPERHPETNRTLLWHEAPALFPIIVETPGDFDSTKVYPAIVALHGFGGSSRAFSRIAPVFTDAGFIVVLPEAPYRVPSDKPGDHLSWGLNTWTPPPLTDDPAIDTRSSELMVLEHIPAALKRVEEEYRMGPKYLLGFSQGAAYAFVTGFYNRDTFDGIIAFGLSGMPSIRDWLAQRGDSIKDGNSLPVLLVNGTEDKLAPYSQSEIALELLKEKGYNVTLHSFVGGHAIPAVELEKAVKWLKGQTSRPGSKTAEETPEVTDLSASSTVNYIADAQRWFRGVYGSDPSVVDELAAEDVIVSYPIFQKLFGRPVISGQEAVKDFAVGFSKRWVETEVTFHETVVQDDQVVLIWSFKGRGVGSAIDDLKPTNEIHRRGGITLIRFNDQGKIVAEIGEESEPGPIERLSTVGK